MIRVSANLHRKVPIPNVQFGSQSFGGAIEVEVSDGASAESVKARLHELYQTLATAVQEELAATTGANNGAPPRSAVNTLPPRSNGNGNGSGNGHRTGSRVVPATQAQRRAITSICKEVGINSADAVADYGVASVDGLTIKQASELIDRLKGQRNSRQ